MDQSKWALPRLRKGVMTKSFQKLERPRLKVQGVWAHNLCLTLNVVEVRQSSDATMVLEALADTLERVYTICRSKNRPTPTKIVIWAPRFVIGRWFLFHTLTLLFLRVCLVGLYYTHDPQG